MFQVGAVGLFMEHWMVRKVKKTIKTNAQNEKRFLTLFSDFFFQIILPLECEMISV